MKREKEAKKEGAWENHQKGVSIYQRTGAALRRDGRNKKEKLRKHLNVRIGGKRTQKEGKCRGGRTNTQRVDSDS